MHYIMNKSLEKFLVRALCLLFSCQAIFKLLFAVIQYGLEALRVHKRPLPPILRDERWGTHKFLKLKKQGVKLHYVEKGDISKPLMVCLHGFPECWLSWRYQLEELSPYFRVVAVDMRGYGESDKPNGVEAYKLNLLVEDMREFIATLTEEKRKCILVGHDWGGIIAWELVEKFPDLFEHHICINGPHAGVFRDVLQTSWTQFRMSWYIFFFQMKWLPEMMIKQKNLEFYSVHMRQNYPEAFPDDVLSVYHYYYSQKGAFTPPLNYYRNAFDMEPLRKSNSKIKVPTLIIWGEKDLALLHEIGLKTMPLCETAEFQLVKNGGHFLQSYEAKEVNRLILNYLKKN